MPWRGETTELKERLKAAEERLAWSEQERKLLLDRLITCMEQRAKEQVDENHKIQRRMDEQEKEESGGVTDRLKRAEKTLEQSDKERTELMERLLENVKISSASAERSRNLAEEKQWLIEDSMGFPRNLLSCCQSPPHTRGMRRREIEDIRIEEIGSPTIRLQRYDS